MAWYKTCLVYYPWYVYNMIWHYCMNLFVLVGKDEWVNYQRLYEHYYAAFWWRHPVASKGFRSTSAFTWSKYTSTADCPPRLEAFITCSWYRAISNSYSSQMWFWSMSLLYFSGKIPNQIHLFVDYTILHDITNLYTYSRVNTTKTTRITAPGRCCNANSIQI